MTGDDRRQLVELCEALSVQGKPASFPDRFLAIFGSCTGAPSRSLVPGPELLGSTT